ncbi:intradiol ring-cleavage dioxygenase [Azotobacter salinestris]|uniref:intradiol ring-cleavage dioxygenase n=1 Tax=Azotobacter salinestris TaxID=69964 RepID=UPI0032DFBC15
MRNLDENTITQAVIERNEKIQDDRLRHVMASLVQHLHTFARDVQLTEKEWEKGIEFLTAVGQICTPTRQEFILLSDTLGLSTLVTAQNHKKPENCTEATVFGPFHVADVPMVDLGADISNGMKGVPFYVKGTVRGVDGEPIPNATIEAWHADEDGFYDVQDPNLIGCKGRAVMQADSNGAYHFKTIMPECYPIPHDGPVGKMLEAFKRHPWRPAHLHFMLSAPGYERLVTHIFREGSNYLESDAVFGVRSSLVCDWVHHESGVTPYGEQTGKPFVTTEYNFILNREKN